MAKVHKRWKIGNIGYNVGRQGLKWQQIGNTIGNNRQQSDAGRAMAEVAGSIWSDWARLVTGMVWRLYWVILTDTGPGEWIVGFVDEWIDGGCRVRAPGLQAWSFSWLDLLGFGSGAFAFDGGFTG